MKWEEKLALAKSIGCNCYESKKPSKPGHCNNKESKIWTWFRNQVGLYLEGKLEPWKMEALERNFSVIKRVGKTIEDKLTWDDAYELCKLYYNKYGNLAIPSNYLMNGYKLGQWILVQRNNYKKRLYITPDRILKLDSIRMIWGFNDNRKKLIKICNQYHINYETNCPYINNIPYKLFESLINFFIDNNIKYIDDNGFLIEQFYINNDEFYSQYGTNIIELLYPDLGINSYSKQLEK